MTVMLRKLNRGLAMKHSEIVNIQQNAMIEVEVGVNCEASTVYHRLSGLVVHHQYNGFGILFTNLDANSSIVLRQLMKEQ